MKLLRALALYLGASACVFAQATLMPMPVLQFSDTYGNPLAGGFIYTCVTGSSCPGTPLAAYTDASHLTPLSNPIILNAAGEQTGQIWLGSGLYRIVIEDANGVVQSDTDPVAGLQSLNALKCAVNGLACLDGSGFVPQAELNYNQGGTGAVNRSVQNKLQESVSALDYAGADIGAKIVAAIAALGAGCGTIHVPRGSYTSATQINADGTSSCKIVGDGGITPGSRAATSITYTGTGTPVSARSSSGFEITDIQTITSNAAFAGTWIDLSHSGLATDSAFTLVKRCSFFSNNGGKAAIGIDLNQAIIAHIEDNFFGGPADVVIRGAASGSYSNSINITGNTFSSSTGTVTTAMISEPGEAYFVANNTFEMGTALGTPKVIACSLGLVHGITFVSNWIGDWTNGATGAVDLEVCGGGWDVGGNEIAGPATGSGTAVSVKNNAIGLRFKSNYYEWSPSTATYFAFGTNVADVEIGAGIYGATGNTFMTGAPVSGQIRDFSGITTFYNSVIASLGGNFTPSTVPANLPATDSGFLIHTGGQGGTTSGRTYIGNGTGFQWLFTKRSSSVDTDIGYIQDNGLLKMNTINAVTAFQSNGTSGATQVVNVRNSTNGGACTITYSGGLFMSTTCP